MWRSAFLIAVLLGSVVLDPVPARGAGAAALTLSPPSGAPGAAITITGSGFAAGAVSVRWDGPTGLTLATAEGPDFSARATVPDATVGTHRVVVVGAGGETSAPFEVTAAAPGLGTGETPGISGLDGGAGTMGDTTASPRETVGSAPAGGAGSPAPQPRSSTAVTVAPSSGGVLAFPTTLPADPAPPAPGLDGTPGAEGGESTATGAEDAVGDGSTLAAGPAGGAADSIDSPAMLGVGLAMALTGCAFLAVRSRLRTRQAR